MLNLAVIFGAKYLYLIVIIFASAWVLGQPKPKQKEILIFACICLPLIFIISEIASRLYYNPRPFVSGHFTPLIPHNPDNGFPSHHVLLVSAVSAIITVFNRRLSVFLWIMTLLVGLSRVYAGVHHMVDVVGSMLISTAGVFITYYLTMYLKKRFIR